MRLSALVCAVVLASAVTAPIPGRAQGVMGQPGQDAPTARPRREPSPGQLALRERQRKCGAEWREAKAKGTTGGQKWPQYWSACNKRMKGSSI